MRFYRDSYNRISSRWSLFLVVVTAKLKRTPGSYATLGVSRVCPYKSKLLTARHEKRPALSCGASF